MIKTNLYGLFERTATERFPAARRAAFHRDCKCNAAFHSIRPGWRRGSRGQPEVARPQHPGFSPEAGATQLSPACVISGCGIANTMAAPNGLIGVAIDKQGQCTPCFLSGFS